MLSDKNIFLIPVGDLLNEGKEDFFLVYAPLHDRMQLVSREVISDIRNNPEMEARFGSVFLEGADTASVHNETNDINEVEMLYIILNYKCNFHCSYCYSAGGRSNKELSAANIEGIIRSYLGKHTRGKTRSITFIGGGEPFLSWNKLRDAILTIRETERELDSSVSIEIVTNGSLLTPELMQFLKENNVSLQVSFEILADIQEKQRAKHHIVSSNVISASGKIPLSVRSVITDMSVERLEEMVEELHTKYPLVRILRCDIEESRNRFATKAQALDFYRKYNDNFLKARKLAIKYKISLDNFLTRSMSRITSRFCNMMLCLVPNGCITSCVCYSSEKEEGFCEFVYGKMENGRISIDQQKYDKLAAQNVWNQSECQNCFLKWHCGGGCIAHRLLHDDVIQQVSCESSRDLFRKLLVQNLELYVHDEYGCSLSEFLRTGKNVQP